MTRPGVLRWIRPRPRNCWSPRFGHAQTQALERQFLGVRRLFRAVLPPSDTRFRSGIATPSARRRRAASAFAHNVTFRTEQVRTSGRSSSHARVTDTGRTNTYHFCPDCGSAVFYEV